MDPDYQGSWISKTSICNSHARESAISCDTHPLPTFIDMNLSCCRGGLATLMVAFHKRIASPVETSIGDAVDSVCMLSAGRLRVASLVFFSTTSALSSASLALARA